LFGLVYFWTYANRLSSRRKQLQTHFTFFILNKKTNCADWLSVPPWSGGKERRRIHSLLSNRNFLSQSVTHFWSVSSQLLIPKHYAICSQRMQFYPNSTLLCMFGVFNLCSKEFTLLILFFWVLNHILKWLLLMLSSLASIPLNRYPNTTPTLLNKKIFNFVLLLCFYIIHS
jgi:hypothetical protein